ncbi:hypothetical protein GGQ93_003234 [Brevundimonas aurantiaca]|uniref:Uncharacterized protein n=1 Tax=Brevundimonas aurantiaca TaxID=74316 RepID=A0A7W9F9R8_9CAUL|nr:hypothetical protein [Brevundimonas aurantiaca]
MSASVSALQCDGVAAALTPFKAFSGYEIRFASEHRYKG